ncbi:MAG: hypothetical protein K2Y23_03650 [Cyanobacteria bacterium]|nr:hypothetical protein [Cyanobacteriota bacterium]
MWVLVAIVLILMAETTGLALNRSHRIDQYGHTSWNLRDGLLRGYPRALAQTPQGHLWVATEFGLVKFDGFQFTDFRPPEGASLPSQLVSSLAVSRDGALWIGTTEGLARWHDGRLKVYAELSGRYVGAIAPTRDGAVWIGTKAVTGSALLCAIRDDDVTCDGSDGRLGRYILALAEDTGGNLWVGTANELWLWRGADGPLRFPVADPPQEVHAIAHGTGADLLVSLNRTVRRFANSAYRPFDVVGMPQAKPTVLLTDRDGVLWIGTQDKGILRVRDGRAEAFGRSEGLSGDFVVSLFEDREGNIWVGTLNGLDRFREVTAARFTTKHGLSSDTILSVHAGGSRVWLNTVGGLNLLENDDVRRVSERPTAEGFSSVYQDRSGRVWVGSGRVLSYLAPPYHRPQQIAGVQLSQAHAITEDSGGTVWVSDQRNGLVRIHPDGSVQRIPLSTLGGRDIRVLSPAGKAGGIWLGFSDGGIALLSATIERVVGGGDGLAPGRVNALHMTGEGVLWVGTEGGLSRIEQGLVRTVRSFNGLSCTAVQWVITDDGGNLWLHTACGLIRVAVADLDRLYDASAATFRVFDNADGVLRYSDLGGFGPKVTITDDGRLWFATYDGLGVVDPKRIITNPVPPSVQVESVTVGRATFEATSGRRLQPLSRDLRIDYTAVSLVAPEKVRFRYRLDGRDSEWSEPTDRRQAFYTDLPPGNYRFRVIAANNHGVWNEQGAVWDFSVAPTFYQTPAFRIITVASVLLTLYLLYRLRMRHLATVLNVRFEERLAERTRIAQDLHDTLLQGFISSSMHTRLLASQIGDPALREKLETLAQRIGAVIEEGRRTVSGLRSTSTDFLEEALTREAEQFRGTREVEIRVIVDGDRRILPIEVRDPAYQIGREALANAFRHANPKGIEIHLSYQPRGLTLSVRDDGCGIDPGIALTGVPDHWGLPGMRDRAEQMNGTLTVRSNRGLGTEVSLWLPHPPARQ